jgi:hypothetical protein
VAAFFSPVSEREKRERERERERERDRDGETERARSKDGGSLEACINAYLGFPNFKDHELSQWVSFAVDVLEYRLGKYTGSVVVVMVCLILLLIRAQDPGCCNCSAKTCSRILD